jgi:hypothetical protein
MLAQLPVTQQIPMNVPAQNPVPLMPQPITWGLSLGWAVGEFSFPLDVASWFSIGNGQGQGWGGPRLGATHDRAQRLSAQRLQR